MRHAIVAKCALGILILSFARGAVADETGYYSGYELSKDAQVTMDEASVIALKMHPRGVITNRALAHETGGTGLRYTFAVSAEAQSYEVGVDAGTGDVIEDRRR